MSEQQPVPEPVEKSDEQRPDKKPKGKQPLLLDTTYTISRLAVVITAFVTALVSLSAGASPFTTALRSGVATLTLGLLMWFINWFVAFATREAVQKQLEKLEKGPGDSGIFEWEA